MEKTNFSCPQCGNSLGPKSGLCDLCGAIYKIDNSEISITGQICFVCGHQTDLKGESCPECGIKYQIECPDCQQQFEPGTNKCPACGRNNVARQTATETDKLKHLKESIIPDKPIRIFIRVALLFAIMWGMFSIFDGIDWHGPQGLGGLLLLLGILSFIVMFVFYSPVFGKAIRHKPKRPRHDDDFALVYRTLDLASAEQLKSLLESEGIPTFIYNRDATTLLPFDIFTGIRVMVPQTMLQSVFEIMDAFGFETDEIALD